MRKGYSESRMNDVEKPILGVKSLITVRLRSQTLHDDVSGAAFHPLDDNLLITHGKGHLTFWTRRKDGFFERTDIIKPVSQGHRAAHRPSTGFQPAESRIGNSRVPA